MSTNAQQSYQEKIQILKHESCKALSSLFIGPLFDDPQSYQQFYLYVNGDLQKKKKKYFLSRMLLLVK